MNVQFAHRKEISGAASTQDHGIVWCDKERQVYIFGVADGHGDQFGGLLSVAVTECAFSFIEDNFPDVNHMSEWITSLFDYIESGVLETGDDGCSFVICVVFEHELICASVGNCSAHISSDLPSLIKKDVGMLYDAASPTVFTFRGGSRDEIDKTVDGLMLTCNHSASSLSERRRIEKCDPDSTLLFLYDRFEDSDYKPIDDFNQGNYHKNKEQEYATVVLSKAYLNAVSTTRCFFYRPLKAYGITHKPTITRLLFKDIFLRQQQQQQAQEPIFALFLGTNGVFDNWVRSLELADKLRVSHDFVLGNFFHFETCINAVKQSENGCYDVLETFMKRNTSYNKLHFGPTTYDDATGILVYISKSSIPSSPSLKTLF
jgi:hypothetical protein